MTDGQDLLSATQRVAVDRETYVAAWCAQFCVETVKHHMPVAVIHPSSSFVWLSNLFDYLRHLSSRINTSRWEEEDRHRVSAGFYSLLPVFFALFFVFSLIRLCLQVGLDFFSFAAFRNFIIILFASSLLASVPLPFLLCPLRFSYLLPPRILSSCLFLLTTFFALIVSVFCALSSLCVIRVVSRLVLTLMISFVMTSMSFL